MVVLEVGLTGGLAEGPATTDENDGEADVDDEVGWLVEVLESEMVLDTLHRLLMSISASKRSWCCDS